MKACLVFVALCTAASCSKDKSSPSNQAVAEHASSHASIESSATSSAALSDSVSSTASSSTTSSPNPTAKGKPVVVSQYINKQATEPNYILVSPTKGKVAILEQFQGNDGLTKVQAIVIDTDTNKVSETHDLVKKSDKVEDLPRGKELLTVAPASKDRIDKAAKSLSGFEQFDVTAATDKVTKGGELVVTSAGKEVWRGTPNISNRVYGKCFEPEFPPKLTPEWPPYNDEDFKASYIAALGWVLFTMTDSVPDACVVDGSLTFVLRK